MRPTSRTRRGDGVGRANGQLQLNGRLDDLLRHYFRVVRSAAEFRDPANAAIGALVRFPVGADRGRAFPVLVLR